MNGMVANGVAGAGKIMQRCISLANGDLSPDLRVNYEFGLVLGVNEFRQEQVYFLEKEYLHNRALHGYGTVSGLNVTLADTGDDIQVAVQPGIGVDQFGRTFVIRQEQCALLEAWLAKQQKTPGVEIPIVEDGEIVVYLVATYDECADALVKIAGQPCSTGDQTTAASRIRDSFNLALRFQPPGMPAWDAVRRFALLMARVTIDAGLPPEQSDEAKIVEVVRVLHDPTQFRAFNLILPGEEPPLGAPQSFRLPLEGATAALDRIFAVWVTEVRPRLAPNLLAPDVAPAGADAAPGEVESGVLLATIRFRQGAGSTPEHPIVEGVTEDLAESVSDEGRPFLLHTQLIQELMMLGSGSGAKPLREFATLHVQGPNSVLVWVHYPREVTLPGELGGSLALNVDDNAYVGTVAPLAGAFNAFEITTRDAVPARARVELRFLVSDVGVSTGGEPPVIQRLADVIETLPYAYVGYEGAVIGVYTFADNLPDVREFVTFATVRDPELGARIQLWVHAPTPQKLNKSNTRVLVGADEKPAAGYQIQQVGGANSPLWLVSLDPKPEDGMLLTFQFDATKIAAGGSTPAGQMVAQQFAYLDYDGAQTITARYVVSLPQVTQEPGGGLTEKDVLELIGRVKTLPFVTVTPLIESFQRTEQGLDALNCDLWFHLDPDPAQYVATVRELTFEILSEINGKLFRLIPTLKQVQRNLFEASIRMENGFEQGQYTFMRFLFPLDKIFISVDSDNPAAAWSGTLLEYIKQYNVKFEGYFGDGSPYLVSYVRTPVFRVNE